MAHVLIDQLALRSALCEYPVELAYLFGSQLDGTVSANSDVDIAVLLARDLAARDRFDLRLELIRKLSVLLRRDADVVILNDVPSLYFRYRIISQGRLLFSVSPAAHAQYESKVMSEYFDFRPFIEQYNAAYLARANEQ